MTDPTPGRVCSCTLVGGPDGFPHTPGPVCEGRTPSPCETDGHAWNMGRCLWCRACQMCPVHHMPDCSPLLNGCSRLTAPASSPSAPKDIT